MQPFQQSCQLIMCEIAAPLTVQVHWSRRLSTGSFFAFVGLCTCCLISFPHRHCSRPYGLLHTCTQCRKYPFLLVTTYQTQRITKQLRFCWHGERARTLQCRSQVNANRCTSNAMPARCMHLFATSKTATETTTTVL